MSFITFEIENKSFRLFRAYLSFIKSIYYNKNTYLNKFENK
jgi:hypothetical protein